MRYRVLSPKTTLLITSFFAGLGVLLAILSIVGGISPSAFENSCIVTFDVTTLRASLGNAYPNDTSISEISDWYTLHMTTVCHGAWTDETRDRELAVTKEKNNDTMVCDRRGLDWTFQLGSVLHSEGPLIEELSELNHSHSAKMSAPAALFVAAASTGFLALIAIFAASFQHGFGPLTHKVCVTGVAVEGITTVLALAAASTLTSSRGSLITATADPEIQSYTSTAYLTLVWVAFIAPLIATILGVIGQAKEKRMHEIEPIGTPVKIISRSDTDSEATSPRKSDPNQVLTKANTAANAARVWDAVSALAGNGAKGAPQADNETTEVNISIKDNGTTRTIDITKTSPVKSTTTSPVNPPNASNLNTPQPSTSTQTPQPVTTPRPSNTPQITTNNTTTTTTTTTTTINRAPSVRSVRSNTGRSRAGTLSSLNRPPPVVVIHGRSRQNSLSDMVVASQRAKARSEAQARNAVATPASESQQTPNVSVSVNNSRDHSRTRGRARASSSVSLAPGTSLPESRASSRSRAPSRASSYRSAQSNGDVAKHRARADSVRSLNLGRVSSRSSFAEKGSRSRAGSEVMTPRPGAGDEAAVTGGSMGARRYGV